MTRACLCGRTTCAHKKRHHKSSGHVYGAAHQELRRRMLADMAAGRIPSICAFCGEGPKPGPTWVWEADHRTPVARGTDGAVRPAHLHCNRSHGAKLLKVLRKEEADRRAALRIEETQRLLRGETG